MVAMGIESNIKSPLARSLEDVDGVFTNKKITAAKENRKGTRLREFI